eukprot:4294273-Pyramimonas_sp.AAC.1
MPMRREDAEEALRPLMSVMGSSEPSCWMMLAFKRPGPAGSDHPAAARRSAFSAAADSTPGLRWSRDVSGRRAPGGEGKD